MSQAARLPSGIQHLGAFLIDFKMCLRRHYMIVICTLTSNRQLIALTLSDVFALTLMGIQTDLKLLTPSR